MKEPETIDLQKEEVDQLLHRLDSNRLTEGDRTLLRKVLQFNLWLQHRLRETKLSVRRLSGLFGIRTEKQPRSGSGRQKGQQPSSDAEEAGEGPLEETPVVATAAPGHGRNSHAVYQGAETVVVPHSTLKPGDPCPEACGGRLYEGDPGMVIRVTGSPIAQATRFQLQKLRCSLCGKRVTASLPPGIAPEDRYDETAKAVLALQKYFLGSPFHRIEAFQQMIGIPLPDAVQWELVEQVAAGLYPVYQELIRFAAQGELLQNDDTHLKILSLMKENQEEVNRKRKGIYTSAILSKVGTLRIALFFSGRQHAGENLDAVLAHRAPELGKVLQMSDALAASQPKQVETISCHCLAHARRKFVEIQEVWPRECGDVLERIQKVYHTEALAQQQGLSGPARLALHQECSGPVMKAFKSWLEQQKNERRVEPNSSLGKAIQYCLNHWESLTRFLTHPGAPLDNNLTERALKIPIRNRKNALFYKSQHGALIGDIVMSVIYTAWLNQINPLEYLIQVQYHRSEIVRDPDSFLPWNVPQRTRAA